MTRVEIFDQDRGERGTYTLSAFEDEVRLPITKDGFEALLEISANVNKLPVDDAMRSVLAGYVHHIPNEKATTTVKTIADMLYKSVSNTLTWQIDQEVKLKRKQLADDLAKKLAEDEALDNVVPTEQH